MMRVYNRYGIKIYEGPIIWPENLPTPAWAISDKWGWVRCDFAGISPDEHGGSFIFVQRGIEEFGPGVVRTHMKGGA